MTDTTAQFKRQLPRNTLLQVLSFISQVAVGILLVPYLVKHLGRAAYGLIPIAGVMTQYVSLVSHSISLAVTRFLTIALQQDDAKEANCIFNTAFISYLVIGLVQVPIFGLIIYHANTIFTIPETLYRDAVSLLICSAASFLINLATSVFTVPIYARNRLDISRAIDIGRYLLRLAGILILFGFLGPALRYVGYVDLAIAMLACVTHVFLAKRLAPILKMSLRSFEWSKVRELTGMGWWLIVNHIGALLFLRTDVWICNRFISAEAAGDYAAILQWSTLIRAGGAVVSGLVAPMIMIYYARSEMDRLIRLSKMSVRVFCLVLAIPISVMCVFSSSLLRIWLGESFTGLAPLMVITLCHLAINVGVSPLFNVKTALNKVKWPGVATVAGGVINLFLAITLVTYFGCGIYGVAITGAVVLTLKNALFMPIYGALILGQPWHIFLKPYLSSVGFLIGLIALQLGLARYYHPTSWAHVALLAAAIGVLAPVVAWFCMPKEDRRTMISVMPVRMRNVLAGPVRA